MSKDLVSLICFVFILIISISLFFAITPSGKAIWNSWFFDVQKADDNTNYETLKKVEDTCRAMIASYQSDILTYEQYKNSENEEKQSWAEQAKMRANKTASSYNNYILQNEFVWKRNVPTDIYRSLNTIE